MDEDLFAELGPPAGFPNCKVCPYRINGPVQVCVRCASAAVQPIPPDHCRICSQALTATGSCANRLCRGPCYITRISAVATYSGDLATKIKALKYQGKWGWAHIFGRLVTGHLDANFTPDEIDLIIPNPTWVQPDEIAHTEHVLRAASAEDLTGRWPLEPDGILVKTGETPKSAGLSVVERAAAAEALPAVLRVPDLSAIRDRRIVVYDDVCTTGSQLNVLARYLCENSARSVEGLVLARAPWTTK